MCLQTRRPPCDVKQIQRQLLELESVLSANRNAVVGSDLGFFDGQGLLQALVFPVDFVRQLPPGSAPQLDFFRPFGWFQISSLCRFEGMKTLFTGVCSAETAEVVQETMQGGRRPA